MSIFQVENLSQRKEMESLLCSFILFLKLSALDTWLLLTELLKRVSP